MNQKEKFCCIEKVNSRKGIFSGILFGIIPHSFCIAFILFSSIGAVVFTTFLKKFLLIPYFFHLLILISLFLATVSTIIYLKKNDCLCIEGIKNKWKYISVLYSTTIIINLLMFFVIIPTLVNASTKKTIFQEKILSDLSLNIQIPCSGHAPLIINELEEKGATSSVYFENPNIFKIKYDPEKTSPEKIVALEIFKTYPAEIN